MYGHGRTDVVYTIGTRSATGVVPPGKDGPDGRAADGRHETLSMTRWLRQSWMEIGARPDKCTWRPGFSLASFSGLPGSESATSGRDLCSRDQMRRAGAFS